MYRVRCTHPFVIKLLQGIKSVSIQWGAWAGAGMAAHDNAILARLERVGLGAIRPAEGLAALQQALSGVSCFKISLHKVSPCSIDSPVRSGLSFSPAITPSCRM